MDSNIGIQKTCAMSSIKAHCTRFCHSFGNCICCLSCDMGDCDSEEEILLTRSQRRSTVRKSSAVAGGDDSVLETGPDMDVTSFLVHRRSLKERSIAIAQCFEPQSCGDSSQ